MYTYAKIKYTLVFSHFTFDSVTCLGYFNINFRSQLST